MIILTGGAGFLGSAMLWELNRQGRTDVLVVDNLQTSTKWQNLVGLSYLRYVHKDELLQDIYACDFKEDVEAIIHLGACSSTTETDCDYLMQNNLEYSKTLYKFARERKARFIYASSAATYGDGSKGFVDDDALLPKLQPLNMYGYSKHLFDLWLLENGWHNTAAGLKFFNVFGPNEYHKDDMRSVVCKAYAQVQETGALTLFRSHREDYGHGEQMRDFVYVKDCTQIMLWLLKHEAVNGFFNIGTGQARTWNDLARAVFHALGKETVIKYKDMPETLREKYQYYTCADLDKLRAQGCDISFRSLEDGVTDYVQKYLLRGNLYLTSRY